jgi:3-mercaptopyruvate sulfurtransferase SseA
MGYTNVSSLAGGLAGYQAAGLPVDRSSPQK